MNRRKQQVQETAQASILEFILKTLSGKLEFNRNRTHDRINPKNNIALLIT